MGADLMLVCNERKENYGENKDGCLKICETSMGFPQTDFGVIMQAYCGIKINDELILKVKKWFECLEKQEFLEISELEKWLIAHKDTLLDTECW